MSGLGQLRLAQKPGIQVFCSIRPNYDRLGFYVDFLCFEGLWLSWFWQNIFVSIEYCSEGTFKDGAVPVENTCYSAVCRSWRAWDWDGMTPGYAPFSRSSPTFRERYKLLNPFQLTEHILNPFKTIQAHSQHFFNPFVHILNPFQSIQAQSQSISIHPGTFLTH